MISVPLPSSYDAAVRRLEVKSTATGSVCYVGPSPFEIPESVEASVKSPYRLTFQFAYPNAEAPEPEERQASVDGSITCRLSSATKKILEVSLNGDVETLIEQPIELRPQYFGDIRVGTTRQTQNAFEQNLRVVRLILGSLPEAVRIQLKDAATRLHGGSLQASRFVGGPR